MFNNCVFTDRGAVKLHPSQQIHTTIQELADFFHPDRSDSVCLVPDHQERDESAQPHNTHLARGIWPNCKEKSTARLPANFPGIID